MRPVITWIMVAAACAAPTEQEDELARARSRWQNAAIRDYTFDFQRSCFCAPTSTRAVSITVQAGATAGLVYVDDGMPADPSLFAGFLTIDQVLDYVRDAIARRPASLLVTYDTELGYPTSVSVDFRSQIADDEFYLVVTGFRRP